MARIQIFELPTEVVGEFVKTPFVFVIDQVADGGDIQAWDGSLASSPRFNSGTDDFKALDKDGSESRAKVKEITGEALADSPEVISQAAAAAAELALNDAGFLKSSEAAPGDTMFKSLSGKKSWLGVSATGGLARITIRAIENALHISARTERPRPLPGNFIIWLRVDGNELTFTIVRNT
ncbi:hypothetical protein [Pseudoclavibacter sp. 8L]|uniref:hypothetical protein n=1 Tax=Pseudoclavibacter sp. 8L TaxID=2653162 RepID=UPI0012F034C2|nr:hypothetical protein [Pseudoclavibacter sp. 8L]VXB29399.1 hypothetical protein PSCLAVI8L_130403 [Pseudoclavibacter sp. 8L]